jgi:hypothetical protein
LVNDPLAWAFSTHRDALGLAIPPARRRVPQPARFHAYVSGDPSVRPEGTPLPPPVLAGEPHPARFRDVVAAVSALTRTPVDKLSEDKDARDLVVNAARLLAGAKLDDLVELTGAPRRSLQRIPIVRSEQVKIVEQVIGDPRFAVLEAGDLRQLPNWERYRHRG